MRTSSAKVASVVFFSAMEAPSRCAADGGVRGSRLGVGADGRAHVGDLAGVRLVDDRGLGSRLGGAGGVLEGSEVVLGVERGGAAGPCGGDGLAVGVVDEVPAGEDAGDV